jgi:hypothetical protein
MTLAPGGAELAPGRLGLLGLRNTARPGVTDRRRAGVTDRRRAGVTDGRRAGTHCPARDHHGHRG